MALATFRASVFIEVMYAFSRHLAICGTVMAAKRPTITITARVSRSVKPPSPATRSRMRVASEGLRTVSAKVFHLAMETREG